MDLDAIIRAYCKHEVLVVDLETYAQHSLQSPKPYPKRYWYAGELLPCVGLAMYAKGKPLRTVAHFSTNSDTSSFFKKVIIPNYRIEEDVICGIAGGRRGRSEDTINELKQELESIDNIQIIHEHLLPEDRSNRMGLWMDNKTGEIGSLFEYADTNLYPNNDNSFQIPRKKKRGLFRGIF